MLTNMFDVTFYGLHIIVGNDFLIDWIDFLSKRNSFLVIFREETVIGQKVIKSFSIPRQDNFRFFIFIFVIYAHRYFLRKSEYIASNRFPPRIRLYLFNLQIFKIFWELLHNWF